MAEFILKDWYGKDCRFNHDTIFVQDVNGELVQFTQGKGESVLESLEVTENGTYTPSEGVDGFNVVSVDVPAPEIKLQTKTITENGTYTADSFYDGLKQVVVDVAGAGASDDVRYVTFMSHDGTIEYGKKAVAMGDDCADPIARGIFDTPTRESDVQYDYTFNGWASEPNGATISNWNKAITEDKTVYASFKASYIYYTVTFYDDDNTTVLSTKSVTYGTDASYTPEKAGYKFVGWSADVTNVTTNMEVYATWQIDDGYIHDSWETVVARAQDGTASNYYSVGDKIVLPLSYTDGTTEEVDLHLVAFNDGNMEDGNPCNIAFVCAEALKTLCAFSTVSLSSSKLTSALWNTNLVVYNHLLNVVLPALPSVLRDNIKVRDMAYSTAPNLKLWLPEEDDFKGLTSRKTCIDIRSAFPDANSRIMYKTDGTGPVEWWTGTPKWTYSYYWGTGYGTDGELIGSGGYINENPPSTPRGVVFGFCI